MITVEQRGLRSIRKSTDSAEGQGVHLHEISGVNVAN
jgi:hypothetical protein